MSKGAPLRHFILIWKGAIITGGGFTSEHATNVAGIIVANANNDEGMVGLNWQSTLQAFEYSEISGIGDAVADATNAGCKVINMSIAFSDFSANVGKKCAAAYKSNRVLVAATGILAQMIPKEYSLDQNYPNPFNPETEISFALPEPSLVRVVVTDMLGREIVTLVDRDYSAGYQRVSWKGTDGSGNKVGSGVYFYRIVATGRSGKQFTKVMKMALTK